MIEQIPEYKDQIAYLIDSDLGRVAWNIFLAVVPLTLSYYLFDQPRNPWSRWGTCLLLGVSFIYGIKRYNNGNILASLKTLVMAFWGIEAIFLAIIISAIAGLIAIDIRSKWGRPHHRSIAWWLGVFVFVAFLPNAPYILTDVIHFYDAVRTTQSVWVNTLVVTPLYIFFIGTGWLSYVFSLINVGRYLRSHHLAQYETVAELFLHILCSIGIYLGRFLRLNSWHIITRPDTLWTTVTDSLIGKFPIVMISLTVLILLVLYSIHKYVLEKLYPNYEQS
jgi:uncharacterized membrane protein